MAEPVKEGGGLLSRRSFLKEAAKVSGGALAGVTIAEGLGSVEAGKETLTLPAIVGRVAGHATEETRYVTGRYLGIPGASVNLERQDPDDPLVYHAVATALSERNGIYVFGGIETGKYRVRLGAKDSSPTSAVSVVGNSEVAMPNELNVNNPEQMFEAATRVYVFVESDEFPHPEHEGTGTYVVHYPDERLKETALPQQVVFRLMSRNPNFPRFDFSEIKAFAIPGTPEMLKGKDSELAENFPDNEVPLDNGIFVNGLGQDSIRIRAGVSEGFPQNTQLAIVVPLGPKPEDRYVMRTFIGGAKR